MIDYDFLKEDNAKSKARVDLAHLLKQPGWKTITKALDSNILYITEQLKEKKDFTSLEQLYAMQERITDFELFKVLPETILTEIQPEVEPEDTDPY